MVPRQKGSKRSYDQQNDSKTGAELWHDKSGTEILPATPEKPGSFCLQHHQASTVHPRSQFMSSPRNCNVQRFDFVRRASSTRRTVFPCVSVRLFVSEEEFSRLSRHVPGESCNWRPGTHATSQASLFSWTAICWIVSIELCFLSAAGKQGGWGTMLICLVWCNPEGLIKVRVGSESL